MVEKPRQILAIGGGSFSKAGCYIQTDLLLEWFFLRLTQKASPSVCFIPTAGGEAPKIY